MHRPGPPQTTSRQPGEAMASGRQAGGGEPVPPGADDRTLAAQGPIVEAVSAAGNPLPTPVPGVVPDLPAEAAGRRTLSTAFVRIGPDGHLTVGLRDGRLMVLRDVVMRARDYCGVQVAGGGTGRKHCGGYADVVAAQPGGSPVPDAPDLADVVARPAGRP